MALHQERSYKKPSGGRLKRYRRKQLAQLARQPSLTKLGETNKRAIRTLGGNHKQRLLNHNVAIVHDKKNNKAKKVKILTILESPANRHYVRANIMTKGTIIETDAGKARISSRPGQHGVVNAVLIS